MHTSILLCAYKKHGVTAPLGLSNNNFTFIQCLQYIPEIEFRERSTFKLETSQHIRLLYTCLDQSLVTFTCYICKIFNRMFGFSVLINDSTKHKVLHENGGENNFMSNCTYENICIFSGPNLNNLFSTEVPVHLKYSSS